MMTAGALSVGVYSGDPYRCSRACGGCKNAMGAGRTAAFPTASSCDRRCHATSLTAQAAGCSACACSASFKSSIVHCLVRAASLACSSMSRMSVCVSASHLNGGVCRADMAAGEAGAGPRREGDKVQSFGGAAACRAHACSCACYEMICECSART